ncbi:redoxin domain-containing protein [Ornithinimicrobium sp. F0845]|uniref:AhpC/TSA family protein n=1 Tax=Ornithinimicrobium sp. F0845 TaxID=2926412 RepID=UPI001FF5D9F1|nr:AhpC/TSA family protein [Ornithinimicrobium sp. F0845]MCK0110703.1 redoxin domain-containing protein [Ornithinimicrobium sp. F0845]
MDKPETRRFVRGDIVPRRVLTTIDGTRVAVPDADALIHLQFRRFAACPICNVHLGTLVRRHEEISAAGVIEVVVFHSEASAMRPHQAGLPFAAVADPERVLYDEFGVGRSVRSLLNPRAWTSPLNPAAWQVAAREWRDPDSRPFQVRGGSITGLPADFLIAPGGAVQAVRYGQHANDQWSVDELLDLVESDAA